MSYTVQNRLRRRFKIVVYILFSLYMIIGTSLFFFQEKLLFLPTSLAQDYEFEFSVPFEEVFLNTDDGSKLNAVHFKIESPKGVILYFHGNAGDLQRWGEITAYFTQYNYDVLVMDYRTYGKSTGTLSETALYKDAQLFYDYALNTYPENKIVIYGRSLGTGIATKIAADNDPQQLILETPYSSIADVAKHRFPFFPVKLLLNYKLPTDQFIKDVSCPITIFHGTEDKVVPYKFGKQLVDINLPNLNFITIEGGKHNNIRDYKIYRNVVEALLTKK